MFSVASCGFIRMRFNSVTNGALQQTEPIHDPFVHWKCCRLTVTRPNVITVRVKIKLTTRTFLARVVWEHLDFDKVKSPKEVWGNDHR
jgi:hypothetical protein